MRELLYLRWYRWSEEDHLCLLTSKECNIQRPEKSVHSQPLVQASQPCSFTGSQVLAMGRSNKTMVWVVRESSTWEMLQTLWCKMLISTQCHSQIFSCEKEKWHLTRRALHKVFKWANRHNLQLSDHAKINMQTIFFFRESQAQNRS